MSGSGAGVTVTGGVAGVEARTEALHAVADHCDACGDRVRQLALRLAVLLTDPTLVASAPFAPASYAEVTLRLGRATGGPSGAVAAALLLEADARAVRAALALLEAADVLAEEAVAEVDAAAVLGLGVLAVGTAPAWRPFLDDHGVTADELGQRALVAHPGLADHLIRGLGGPGVLPGAAGAAAGLSLLYERGHGRAERRDVAMPGGAPSTVTALTEHLAAVAALARTPDGQGTIEVQTLHTPDGPRHIVYLPGTDDMTTLPWQRDGDVRDMGANLELVGGRGTAYGDGVLAALAQAGVRSDEPVLLVGHSQGGLLAGRLATEGGHGYDVVGAVTLGAPLGTVPHLPDGVGVLALENSHDLVPHLDGRANPDEVGLVTLTADGGGGDVVGAHEFPAYEQVAAAADASTDPSVTAQLAAFGAAGFLRGGAGADTTSQVFRITREP